MDNDIVDDDIIDDGNEDETGAILANMNDFNNNNNNCSHPVLHNCGQH